MKSISRISVLICVVVFFAALGSTAQAEIRPGVRLGGYFDAGGVDVGGEILANTAWRNWYFNPNVELVFADRAKLATFNFDFHYDLPMRSGIYMWVGGGPAIMYWNPDNDRLDSETDFALNVLMGIGFSSRSSRVIPYIQPKVILSDHSDFALDFGVRF